MVDTKTALAQLGWRVDTSARLAQAIKDFQRMWNLGPALVADGVAGPATRAALAKSLERRATRQPDISEHFSALEFACACAGRWADCRRIWTPRYVVQMAEAYRGLVGPYSPDRGCRCPRENARVGGVSNSQHLYGLALDVPLYAVTSAQVQQLGLVSGIGVYLWNGRRYVRHIDARHLRGSTSTPSRPATWDYGTAKSAPLAPAPVPEPAPTTVTTPPEEDDMLPAEKAQLSKAATEANYAHIHAKAARAEVAALSATVAAFIAAGGSLTAEQITAASKAGAAAALADVIDSADVTLNITKETP